MANITHGSVTMTQTGFGRFTVTYGAQVTKNLNYAGAAKEFGECVMHEACCNSKLDNRTRAEAKADGDTEPYFDAS